jgi:hypothetical protein
VLEDLALGVVGRITPCPGVQATIPTEIETPKPVEQDHALGVEASRTRLAEIAPSRAVRGPSHIPRRIAIRGESVTGYRRERTTISAGGGA